MCNYVGATPTFLLKHAIRYHKNDLLFKISCTNDGCAASFRRLNSFYAHVRRSHPNVNLNLPVDNGFENVENDCNDNRIAGNIYCE